MRKSRLLKQGLAVLISLSMSLGPSAPGNFDAFADTAGFSPEIEMGTDEVGTGAEEEAGAQGAEVSEEAAGVGEEASNDNVGEVSEGGISSQGEEEPGAGESDGEDKEDGETGEQGGEDGSDENGAAVDEGDSEADFGDEVTPFGEGEEDGSASESRSEDEGDTSAADQEETNAAAEEGGSEKDPADAGQEIGADETEEAVEADTVSETAQAEAETETEAAPKNIEIEAEVEVKTESRHVLQAEVDETIISVIYDDGVFPENVTLEVRKIDEDSAEQEEIFEIIKKSVDAEENNVKNEEEFPDGLIASSFEIKILDEEENEVRPDVGKGTVYIRLDHLEYPADETKGIRLENKVRVFELTDISEGKIKELKNADAETDKLSIDDDMIPEGAVIDDINNRSESSEEEGVWAEDVKKTSFTAEIFKCGYIVVLWSTEKEISEEVIPENGLSFDQSIIVDGIIINVTAEDGVFPKEAALSAVRIPSEKIETELKEGRKKDQNIAASYTFDIKILDEEGNELQPTDEQKVRVSFTAGEVADKNLETQVYHISDEGTVEDLEVNVIEDTAFVSADGFSLYTVEFTYDKLQYVLEGDSSVRLSLILEVLGLYGEVTDVLCSNTDLFTAEQFDGDWTVSALQPFTSEEWMLITINDIVYKIIVTDNPSNPASTPRITYEGQVVDSITYRGVTINAVYRPYRASDAEDGTYGCFVLCTNFYSRIYGIRVTNMFTTSSVPQASRGYFTETRSPLKGDIVRFNTKGPHWALVKSVSGSTVTLIQQNYWYNNFTCAQVGVTVDASDASVSFFRYSGWLPDNNIPSSPAVPDGDYLIVNTAHNGTSFYYVDIEGTALPAANHTNVILTGPVQGTLPDYEAWTLKYADGYYTITQKGTDMALDVAGGSAANEANVQVYSANNSDAQKWSITYNERNGYSIRAKCSGRLLDAVDGGRSNGTNIHQYTENGSDDQSWLLIPYKPSQTLQNGRYVLLSGVNSSFELDVPGDTGNVDNGLALQLWDDSTPSKYNSFDITRLSDGYYKIIHAASGKAVEIPGGSSLQSKRLALYDDNGSMAQKWAITQHSSDGCYVLRPFCSGYAMDLAGAVTSNGRSVAQYQFNWSNAQKWFFVKAEHSVRYNANGGFGAPAAQTKYYKEILTLSSAAPVRYGYVFKGWAETSGAAAATYLPGKTFSEEKDITLYAVWEKNTQDPIEVLIRHLYSACLDREADAGGLDYWKGRIHSGTSKGIGFAGSFVFSKEFTSKNYCNEHFAAQLYPALMGREPDAGGLAFWVGNLDKGVTREAMVNSFTSSNEYKSLCSDAGIELGPQLKDTDFGAKKGVGTKPYGPCAVCGAKTKVVQFAERMYTECMKRPADTEGLAYWSKGLYEQTISGKSILDSFFLSNEMKNMGLSNQEYVRRIYKTMLDRDPDAGGLDYWTGLLNKGSGPTAVINGFVDSAEFTRICNEYGIKRK